MTPVCWSQPGLGGFSASKSTGVVTPTRSGVCGLLRVGFNSHDSRHLQSKCLHPVPCCSQRTIVIQPYIGVIDFIVCTHLSAYSLTSMAVKPWLLDLPRGSKCQEVPTLQALTVRWEEFHPRCLWDCRCPMQGITRQDWSCVKYTSPDEPAVTVLGQGLCQTQPLL